MSNEATSKSGKTWLLLVSLPLCYVLSVGPLTVLVVHGLLPASSRRFVESAYTPLTNFAKSAGTIPLLQSYQVAWLELTGTPAHLYSR